VPVARAQPQLGRRQLLQEPVRVGDGDDAVLAAGDEEDRGRRARRLEAPRGDVAEVVVDLGLRVLGARALRVGAERPRG